jgi:hypothetical protein
MRILFRISLDPLPKKDTLGTEFQNPGSKKPIILDYRQLQPASPRLSSPLH